jgi:multisubunit Na+/H+ antiporter MnhF subunit
MKKFLRSLLSANGEVSSKRSIGISASLTIIFASIVDLFSNYTITDYVFEGLVWLAIAGLGFIASEKFATYITNKNTKE